MPRAALAKMLNGLSEELQGLVIASLAADHAPVGRIDVSQGDVIIGAAQDSFRFFQDLRRLALVSFLEVQPAFQHAHDRGHLFMT